MEKYIYAFWHDDETDPDESGYLWECPTCGELNYVGDDFQWNSSKGRHQTKSCDYFCENEKCTDQNSYGLYRD